MPIGDQNEPSIESGVPTVLIVDASASMLTDDAPGLRVDAARSAATKLIDILPGDAVLGLVTYGTETTDSPDAHEAGCRDVTTLAAPSELDAHGYRANLTDQIAGLTPSGFTPIALSLRHAADLLPEGDAAIIVISDGEDSCGQPPCEVAAELSEQHPGLHISTVGFMTASPELSCIARSTGGLFVTADDADQLATRLLAARDIDANVTALTATGLAGIDIGTHYNDAVRAHDSFPHQSAGKVEGDTTVITYLDCDYVFDADGIVIEIRPLTARTIDGLTVADPLSTAIELYGEPVADPAGNDYLLFPANLEAGTAWKIKVDDDNEVSSITLCRCLPSAHKGASNTTVSGETTIITSRPYLSDGSLDPEYGTYTLETVDYGCHTQEDFYSCGPWATGLAGYFCSIALDGRAFCPSGEPGNRFFASNTVREVFDDSQNVLLRLGTVTYRVTLDDGQTCIYGVPPGGEGYGAYQCEDGEQLAIVQGGSVFHELPSGTWTAKKADFNARNFSTVTVVHAENYVR